VSGSVLRSYYRIRRHCAALLLLQVNDKLIMAAQCNRAGHIKLFFVKFFSSFFPRLISAVVGDLMSTIYFHTWCGVSVNLECRSETCCARLAENTARKNGQKVAIWSPSHNFVGLYLRN